MTQFANGQSLNSGTGARSTGMGDASTTVADPYAVGNNVGGLGRLDQFFIYASYEIRYNLIEISRQAAGIIIPLRLGNIAFDLNRLGGGSYKEQSAGLSYSNQFGLASLGLKMNYYQMLIEGLSTRSALVFEFGGIAEITPQLLFGAHIHNLSQSGFLQRETGALPTVIKAGLSYRPSKKFMVNLELMKDIDFDPILRLGLEYRVFNFLQLRTGINDQPFQAYAGLGFSQSRLSIDYSFAQHGHLGGSSQISLSYRSSKNKDEK